MERVAENSAMRAQSTKEAWNDFAYTGPGTLAGRYIRLYWQPVYVAEDLPVGRPKPLRVLSEDFTIYKGQSGEPHLVDFRCAHRGTQLTVGWVEGEEIRCRYHGWKFAPNGQCTEQPGEPEPFCDKIRIKAYPTREYLGLIFAYLGDGEPPPFPRYKSLEEAAVRLITFDVRDCNFFNNLENDPLHVYFTHHRTHRSWRKGLPTKFLAEETPYGMQKYVIWPDGRKADGNINIPPVINYRPNLKKPGEKRGEWDGKDTTKLASERGDVIGWKLPLDDEHHYFFQVEGFPQSERTQRYIERRKRWLAQQASVEEVVAKVFKGEMHLDDIPVDVGDGADVHWVNAVEDAATQCGQGAIADRTVEHLGRTDVSVILLRKIWQRELRALAEGLPLTQWLPIDPVD
jgi:5,5'-dehydrodivanillate O-demethylase oxygenase subunit